MERLIDTETERSISTGALSDLHRRGILQFVHADTSDPVCNEVYEASWH